MFYGMVKFWRNFPQREASDKAIPYHLTSLFYTLRGFLQLISIATDQGVWHPIRLSRNDPHITHLAFANDVILFAEASLDQVHSIKNILNLFCRSSSRRSIWISLRCSFPIMLVGKWNNIWVRRWICHGLGIWANTSDFQFYIIDPLIILFNL